VPIPLHSHYNRAQDGGSNKELLMNAKNRHRRNLAVPVMALSLSLAPARAVDVKSDLAELMPESTLVYVGWTELFEEKTANDVIQMIRGIAVASGNGDDAPMIDRVLALAKIAVRNPAGLALLDIDASGREPVPHLALVVAAGADSKRLADGLSELVAAHHPEARSATIGDVALRVVDVHGTQVLWGAHRERFLLALGEPAAQAVIASMNGGPSLAASTELKLDRSKVAAKLDGRTFCAYANADALLAKVLQFVPEDGPPPRAAVNQVLEALGIKQMRSYYLHAQLDEKMPSWQAFLHAEGPSVGLLKLWDQKPLTDDDLRIIPKSAHWACVSNLDLAGLWAEIVEVIGRIDPNARQTVEKVVQGASGQLGFSPTDDLLPVFGDTWALYDAPAHGGLLFTGTVLAAEAKDPAKLHGLLTQIVELIQPMAAQGNVNLTLNEMRHGQHGIHYLLVGGLPVPIAPAWGFVGERCVLGLFPQTVAAALDEVDAAQRGESILDHPDYRALRPKLPKTVQSLTYVDTRYYSEMFYGLGLLVQTAAVSMASSAAPMDLGGINTLADDLKGVTNALAGTSYDQDGVHFVQAGHGVPAMMVAAGAALSASVLMPSMVHARHRAQRTVSMANMKGIGMACMIYANDNDERLPPSLHELVEQGQLTPEQLRAPLDPHDGVSYVYISGQRLLGVHPRDVLAYERHFDDEGRCILFADGHVEFLAHDAAKNAVRETYRRLKREDELPPDMQE